MTLIQRTLILCKPDSVSRGLVWEIITRFEKVGLKIVGMKMLKPNADFFHHHYETIGTMITRRWEKAFKLNLEAMQKTPVIAIVLEGVEAIGLVRKMAGTTESKSANPGTIRGDYSHMSFDYADKQNIGLPNIIHASGDEKEAELEIKHRFNEEELFEYKKSGEEFLR